MKRPYLLLAVALLAGCAGRVIDLDGAPPVDTGSEALHILVPEGSKMAFQENRPRVQIREYVPRNQSTDRWSEMLTVLVMDREVAPDIETVFQRMTAAFKAGCAVDPVIQDPRRFFEGPYPAGIQTVVCGKSRQFGYGEVVVYKLIQGTKGFFQVQRAWRFPPAASSGDLTVTPDMAGKAADSLAGVYLCDRQNPDDRCRP